MKTKCIILALLLFMTLPLYAANITRNGNRVTKTRSLATTSAPVFQVHYGPADEYSISLYRDTTGYLLVDVETRYSPGRGRPPVDSRLASLYTMSIEWAYQFVSDPQGYNFE